MKKRILLFTAIAGMAYVTLTSGKNGAGHESGYNATGSELYNSNINGCKVSGCHGTTATTGITVQLELDSAGSPIHHYVGGKTYTVKITGTNTTSNTLPKFGFQVSCIKGTTAFASGPTINGGTFASTGLPANVQFTASNANFGCNLIEHSNPIDFTTSSNGGGSGTTYVESFSWTAPAAGTGSVSFWGALNAVNNDDAITGDFWNTTNLVVKEWTVGMLNVANESTEISMNAFPNPVINTLNLQMDNAQAGSYAISITDINGKSIANENINVTGSSYTTNINTSKWAPGMYIVAVEKDGTRKVTQVMKQ